MNKKCCKCGVDKPLSDFYYRGPTPRNKRGVYSSDCKACVKAYRKNRYHTDPDVKARAKVYSTQWKRDHPDIEAARRKEPRYQEHRRKSALKQLYGTTSAEFEAMEVAQGSLCAICGQPERSARNRRLTIDHDHLTNAIRALLCSQCNRAIGLLADDPNIIRKAADYIERFRHKEN